MIHDAVLATDSTWILTMLWPILLFLLIGWLLLRIVNRFLFGPPGGKGKSPHERQHDSIENLPDPWSESARRLKVDSPEDDSDPPPMRNPPDRPQQPPQ